MALLSSLYPDILPYVPGCPDPVVEQEIRRAAQEFFRCTRAWVDWLADITTTAGARQYNMLLPADSEVYRLEKATLDGSPIEVQIWRLADAEPETNVVEGGVSVMSHDRVSVLLGREPAAGQKLKVQVILSPSDSATTVPDALWFKHKDAICEGAKHRLMRMPGPMSKPKEAREAYDRFETAIAAMSVESWRGHTPLTPRAKPKWC